MPQLAQRHQTRLIEAGCDEAGRGCLAGPVVAAAVILDPKRPIDGLNDSKKLTERERERLRPIIEQQALAWAVGQCSPEEIDKHNILRCSFMAMHRALAALSKVPGLLLIDGNRFDAYGNIPHLCMIKGDGRFAAIAAASILAKTHRDEQMYHLAEAFPNYGWQQNKGYPTKAHRQAIRLHGTTQHHRLSFTLLQPELPLNGTPLLAP